MSLPKAFVAAPTEGESFVAGPFTIVSRVQGEQSNGLFELYELALGPSTIDYHVHNTMDETLTVLEGQIEFNVAGTKFLRPAGSVAFVPRGVHHGFTNLGPAKARVLILFTPARLQHEYFRALEKLFTAPKLDATALAVLQKQYDQSLILTK
jgi:quercetin dioxygenase-like cupin family protein